MGSNPVLGQELRRVLRHGRSFLVLAVYVATLAGVIAVVYPHEGIALYHGRNPSEIGRTLFEAFTRAQFLLVLLLVPALAAPALTVEKEKRTLESLLVSGLTPHQIGLGKFYVSLLYVSLLLATSLPLTSVSLTLGGVSPLELAQAYGLALALAVVLTLLCLAISAAVSRSHVALVLAYGLVAGLVVVYVWPSLVGGLVLAAACAALAGLGWVSLCHSGIGDGRLRIADLRPRSLFSATRNPPSAIGERTPGRSPRYGVRPFISDKINPVLAHELRGSLFGRKEQFGRALYVVTIGTELLLILLGRRSEALTLLPLLLRGYGVGSVVAVLAVGAVLGALTFSLEREQRRLALLLTTRLTARAMVWGKYAAACYYTGYLVLASLPVTGFACLLGFLPLRAALLVTAGLLVWGGWATAMGLWCSLIFPRARSAVGAALGVVLALVGGSALAAGLMPTVFRPEHPVLALLPPYVTNCFMSGFAPGIMPSLTTSCTGAGSMMNGALIYLACLVPLLGLAPWLFERFVRRAESA